jgi:hypothetical protein
MVYMRSLVIERACESMVLRSYDVVARMLER